MEERTMPRTTGESIFYTAITAWMMVYVMTLYNTVLAMGRLAACKADIPENIYEAHKGKMHQ